MLSNAMRILRPQVLACVVVGLLLLGMIPTVSAAAGASITSWTPPAGTLHRGDNACTSVTVKNTGSASQAFWIGVSYYADAGDAVHVPAVQTSSLAAQASQTKNLCRTLPADTDLGWYNVVAAVYDDQPPDDPSLDYEERNDAFQVQQVATVTEPPPPQLVAGQLVRDDRDASIFYLGERSIQSLPGYLADAAADYVGQTVVETMFEWFFGKSPKGGFLIDLVAATGGGLSVTPEAKILTLVDGGTANLGCERFACWLPAPPAQTGQLIPVLVAVDLNAYDPARFISITLETKLLGGSYDESSTISLEGLPAEGYGLYLIFIKEAINPALPGTYEVKVSGQYDHPNTALGRLDFEMARVGFHVERATSLAAIHELERADHEVTLSTRYDDGEVNVTAKSAADGIHVQVTSDVKAGKTIGFNLARAAFGIDGVENLRIWFDRQEIAQADDFVDVMKPGNEEVAEYYAIVDSEYAYILISIPFFSPHEIHIQVLESSPSSTSLSSPIVNTPSGGPTKNAPGLSGATAAFFVALIALGVRIRVGRDRFR